MIFLGTGGAQLMPAAACECDVCRGIRTGADTRNIRGRSAFQLDAKTLIDLGPDTNLVAGMNRVSFSQTENVFFTHTDLDHFSVANALNFRKVLSPVSLTFWFPEDSLKHLAQWYETLTGIPGLASEANVNYIRDCLTVRGIKPYETFRVGDLCVTGLVANHAGIFKETALNYLFERGGKRFLYATDTGLWCEENFAFISGKPLDYAVMECTHGPKPLKRDASHLNFDFMAEMADRLTRVGAFTADTKLYATHINHKCGMMHAAFDAKMKELFGPNAAAGYDGLDIGNF